MSKNNKNYKNKKKGKGNYDSRGNTDPRDYKDKPASDRTSSQRYEDRAGDYVNKYAGTENDPSWYKRNAVLVGDAAKFSFYNQLGASVDQFDASMDTVKATQFVPGVCRLNMVLTPGYSKTTTDPASTAAIGVFEYVRSKLNKPVSAYEAQDMFMLIFAIDQVYALYNYILRAFGMLRVFSSENLYMPWAILHAGYGWTKAQAESMIANLANLQYQFNYLIEKASFLYLPTDFTIVSRHSWLFSNYFVDHSTSKGQIYIHKMGGYYQFDETAYDTGTCCKYHPLEAEDLPALLNIFNECIEAIRNSSAARIMTSDMRQAFQDRSQWKLAYCDDKYTVLPSYSEEVLSQIENTDIVGLWGRTPDETLAWEIEPLTKDVKQDVNNNAIVFAPKLKFDDTFYDLADDFAGHFSSVTPNELACYGYMFGKSIINIHHNDPTVDDVLVATRDKVAWNKDGTLDGIGSDIVTYVQYYRAPVSGSYPQWWTFKSYGWEGDFTETSTWSAFDWAPMINSMKISSGKVYYNNYLEYDNYTTIDRSNIRRLHTAVLNSMWSIPQFGTYEAS